MRRAGIAITAGLLGMAAPAQALPDRSPTASPSAAAPSSRGLPARAARRVRKRSNFFGAPLLALAAAGAGGGAAAAAAAGGRATASPQ